MSPNSARAADGGTLLEVHFALLAAGTLMREAHGVRPACHGLPAFSIAAALKSGSKLRALQTLRAAGYLGGLGGELLHWIHASPQTKMKLELRSVRDQSF